MAQGLFRRLATTIHRIEESQISRRGFLRVLTLASVSYFLASIPVTVRAMMPLPTLNKRMRVPDADQLGVGEAMTFRYPGPDDPALLLRLDESTYKAYNQKCTHLQCPVHWRKDEGVIFCPCHEGYFDPRTGTPLQGPPQRPLQEIELEVTDGQVYAVGRREGAIA